MSSGPELTPPGARSPLPAALVGVAVHLAVWVFLFTGLAALLAEQQRTLADYHVQLPQATRWAFVLGRLLALEPVVAGIGLAALLSVDLYLLFRLGRGGYRVFRELWSGVMVALPVAVFATLLTSVLMTHHKLMMAMMRPVEAMSGAEQAERDRLAGKWVLRAVERDGVEVPAPAVVLTIKDRGFTWDEDDVTRAGSIFVTVTRNPLGITMWQAEGPEPGTVRHGLYKFEGDRLVLCLGQPEALGQNLPADFTTKGTKNELLIFSKAE